MKKTCGMMMVIFCLSVGLVGTVVADPITLSDENSTAQFDLGSAGVGMNQWVVDGMTGWLSNHSGIASATRPSRESTP